MVRRESADSDLFLGVDCKARCCLRRSRLLELNRVDPLDLGEAGEVGISGAHADTVLDGQCCEVCIGYEIPAQVTFAHQSTKDLRMPTSGLRNPGGFGIEPVRHELPGLVLARVGRPTCVDGSRCAETRLMRPTADRPGLHR